MPLSSSADFQIDPGEKLLWRGDMETAGPPIPSGGLVLFVLQALRRLHIVGYVITDQRFIVVRRGGVDAYAVEDLARLIHSAEAASFGTVPGAIQIRAALVDGWARGFSGVGTRKPALADCQDAPRGIELFDEMLTKAETILPSDLTGRDKTRNRKLFIRGIALFIIVVVGLLFYKIATRGY